MKHPEPFPALTGGCQCGAVRYRLLRAPVHASICHCRMCQKASGQPFMALASVPYAQLRWTKGAPPAFRSSNLVERHFCGECGTPLTYRDLESEEISVAMGSLDDPEITRPAIQYGVESEISWFATLHELPVRQTQEEERADWLARMVSRQHPDRPDSDEAGA